MNMNNLGMVGFLFIAAVPNVLFSARSLRDYVSRDSHLRKALPSAPPALLSTAIAEMSWVLPCLVQCFASLFDASFLPDNNETACNVMGVCSCPNPNCLHQACSQLHHLSLGMRSSTASSAPFGAWAQLSGQ